MPFIVDPLLLPTELTPSWLLDQYPTLTVACVGLQTCRVARIALLAPWGPTLLPSTLASPKECVRTWPPHEAVREATFSSSPLQAALLLLQKVPIYCALGL